MELALSLEKLTNEKLLSLHRVLNTSLSYDFFFLSSLVQFVVSDFHLTLFFLISNFRNYNVFILDQK